MMETVLRTNRLRDIRAGGRIDRGNLLAPAATRRDPETETSISLAAAIPSTLGDRADATTATTGVAHQTRTEDDVMVHDVRRRLAERLPGRIRDLQVEARGDSALEISGVASSYYVKQVAQHIAMDVARRQRVINRIEVRVPR